jgi:hypothetical protein
MNGQNSEVIKEILQLRLLNLTKEFKTLLEQRTLSIKKNQNRRNQIAIVGDIKSAAAGSRKNQPSFLDDSEEQAQEEVNYLESRA